MRVKIRHFEDVDAAFFTEIEYTELDDLILFIKRTGGVYCKGNTQPFHSYQLICDGLEAYAEIIIGDEKDG